MKRLINRVSVDAAFFKKLSPMENLTFAARVYGLDVKVARMTVYAILERLQDQFPDNPRIKDRLQKLPAK